MPLPKAFVRKPLVASLPASPRPIRNAPAKVIALNLEPEPRECQIKRIELREGNAHLLVQAKRNLRVTCATNGSGVVIGTTNAVADGDGFPLNSEAVPVTVFVRRGSQLLASGPDGTAVSVIVQPG